MWPAIIIACAALLFGVAALALAGHTWHNAPGSRLWRDLQGRVEDLEHDNRQLHERLHKRARVENVTKATEVRGAKRVERDSVLEEAEAVLAAGSQPQPPKGPQGDSEAQLAHWRRVAGIIH